MLVAALVGRAAPGLAGAARRPRVPRGSAPPRRSQAASPSAGRIPRPAGRTHRGSPRRSPRARRASLPRTPRRRHPGLAAAARSSYSRPGRPERSQEDELESSTSTWPGRRARVVDIDVARKTSSSRPERPGRQQGAGRTRTAPQPTRTYPPGCPTPAGWPPRRASCSSTTRQALGARDPSGAARRLLAPRKAVEPPCAPTPLPDTPCTIQSGLRGS